MKKKLMLAAIAAVVGVGGFAGFNAFQNNSSASDILLTNAEALSNDEQGGSSTSWTCWSQSKKSSGGFWRCGNPCMWVDGEKGISGQAICR